MWIGILLSALILIPLAGQIQTEEQRSIIEPLNSKEISYCEIAACSTLPLAGGLEITAELDLQENEFGVNARLRVINHGMALGTREFWLELRSAEGDRIESMRGMLTLGAKGPQYIEFFFTGTKGELEAGSLILGY